MAAVISPALHTIKLEADLAAADSAVHDLESAPAPLTVDMVADADVPLVDSTHTIVSFPALEADPMMDAPALSTVFVVADTDVDAAGIAAVADVQPNPEQPPLPQPSQESTSDRDQPDMTDV